MTVKSGLEIRGCWEPRAPLNSPAGCGSLKFLQGAQRCTGFYTEHLQVALEDGIGLPGKNLNFEPWKCSITQYVCFGKCFIVLKCFCLIDLMNKYSNSFYFVNTLLKK